MFKFTDITIDRKVQTFYTDRDRLICVNPTTKGTRTHQNLIQQAGIIPHTIKENKLIRATEKRDRFGIGSIYLETACQKSIDRTAAKNKKKLEYRLKQAKKQADRIVMSDKFIFRKK